MNDVPGNPAASGAGAAARGAPWPPGEGEMARRVRAHDWASTPLGPVGGWPQSLRTAVDVVLGSGYAMQLAWGPERTVLYNDAYAPMLGNRHPSALGLPFREAWPDVWEEIEPLVERVFAGGETVRFEDMPLVMTRHGYPEDTWWNFSYSPVRGEAGAVAGLLNVTVDATPKVRADRAERTLRDSEERQAFLLELTDVLRPLTDSGDIERRATRLLGEHLKADRCFLSPVTEDGTGMCVREEYLRSGASSVLGDYTFAQFGDFVGPALHAGRVLAVEDVAALTGLDAAERASYAAVGIGAYLLIPLVRDGRLAAFLTVNHRTSRTWSDADEAVARQTADRLWAARERGRAEAALRESEARFRALVTAGGNSIYRMSPDWRLMYQLESANIANTPEPIEGWADKYILAEDRPRVHAAIAGAIRTKSLFELEHRVLLADGGVGWVLSRAVPLLGPDGEIVEWFGAASDVTERRRMQERQGVLVAELQHRTRNLIGVVRAIADKAMARSADIADFRDRFGDRLAALARVQGLLSRLEEWDRVTFEELIGSALSVLDGEAERVSLEGPHGVALRSSTVQTFALALHELVTNAIKYGALARSQGRLEIRWRLDRAGADRRPWLHVDWRERGVAVAAEATPPHGGGSGRELIERALPYQLGAKTTFAMEADGVHCTIALPVSERQATGGVADV